MENIDIDKEILDNIDIDKILNRLEFGISNRAIHTVDSTGHHNLEVPSSLLLTHVSSIELSLVFKLFKLLTLKVHHY